MNWASLMPEFQTWMKSDLQFDCPERQLWLSGSLGVGKSIMAAYFIDLLNTLYPTAIVGYFFCRSGQKGLTRAQEIVRTLAYQCIQGDEDARNYLETLRSRAFNIDDLIGLRYLTQRLIAEPLKEAAREVFIVIDGLDEADLDIPDAADRVLPPPEIHVLLQQLGCLPRTRLLIVSRPVSIVHKALPKIVTRSVGQSENWEDIQTYVRQTIASSTNLQSNFEKVGINAVEYFNSHAKGVFLWVVLVLKQLETVRTKATFSKHLSTFSKASGGMDILYSDILSKFDEEGAKWLREILMWLVAAAEGVTLNLVKEGAEWFMGDELLQFHDFVEVDCGTLLHLISTDSDTRIELVHETLRTYLTDSVSCPSPIPLAIAHEHILDICLGVLSASPDLPVLTNYASGHWVHHAPNASRSALALIHNFLQSDGYRLWLSSKSFKFYRHVAGLCRGAQEDVIIGVYNEVNTVDVENSGALVNDATLLVDNKTFDIYNGKAWTEIWAYDESDTVSGAFMLALRNYRSRCGQKLSDFIPKSIVANNFAELLGHTPKYTPKSENLGIACAVLREWDESIRYLAGLPSDKAKQYLGLAYIQTGDYKRAIEELKDVGASDVIGCRYLGLAYWGNGNIGGAIEAFEAAWRFKKSDKTLVRLSCLYLLQGSNGIEMYKSGVDEFRDQWWAWQFLCGAMMEGDVENSIATYSRAISMNRDFDWALEGLQKAEFGKQMNATQGPSHFLSLISGQITANAIPQSPSLHHGTPGSYFGLIPSQGLEEIPNDWFFISNTNARHRFKVSLKHTLNFFDAVTCLAFSRTGELLATGCYESVHIFNMKTFITTTILIEESQVGGTHILAVSFSPDGQYLAVGTTSPCINIWDIQRNFVARKLPGHESGKIMALEFSQCGNFIASGTQRGEAKLWNLLDESRTIELVLPQVDSVQCFSFSPDGRLFAAGTDARDIVLWHVKDGSLVKQFGGHQSFVQSVVFAPNGRQLVSGSYDGTVRLWDLDADTTSSTLTENEDRGCKVIHCLRGYPSEQIRSVDWSPDGKWIISADDCGRIQLYDETGQIQFVLFGHTEPGFCH